MVTFTIIACCTPCTPGLCYDDGTGAVVIIATDVDCCCLRRCCKLQLLTAACLAPMSSGCRLLAHARSTATGCPPAIQLGHAVLFRAGRPSRGFPRRCDFLTCGGMWSKASPYRRRLPRSPMTVHISWSHTGCQRQPEAPSSCCCSSCSFPCSCSDSPFSLRLCKRRGACVDVVGAPTVGNAVMAVLAGRASAASP